MLYNQYCPHSCSGSISGAKVSEYLLEKSRIVSHAQGERNYHVFYELLSGLGREELDKYGLKDSRSFFYVNQVGLHASWSTTGRMLLGLALGACFLVYHWAHASWTSTGRMLLGLPLGACFLVYYWAHTSWSSTGRMHSRFCVCCVQ